MDRLNGSLLWVTSAMALFNATLRSARPMAFMIWLLASATIGVVAIDELFMLHEKAIEITGDDDHPKILLIACAGVGIYILSKIERLHTSAQALLWCGFFAHFCYLLADMGDGDYFDLPLGRVTLTWIEEYLELTSTALYFSALYVQCFNVVTKSKKR
ncbi:MAG: hypothetical protein CMH11_20485 [Maritimibacter sp.]|nr:hypothetical protein [Maritimibacter sp.]